MKPWLDVTIAGQTNDQGKIEPLSQWTAEMSNISYVETDTLNKYIENICLFEVDITKAPVFSFLLLQPFQTYDVGDALCFLRLI